MNRPFVGQGESFITAANEARRLATDLISYELLTELGGQPLMQVVEQLREDVVALIPDYALMNGAWLDYGASGSLGDVWDRWRLYFDVVRDSESGVIKIRASDIHVGQDVRFDRRAFSDFVKSFERHGSLTLEAAANLMANETGWRIADRNWMWALRFLPVPLGSPSSLLPLVAYGALSNEQRAEARKGGITLRWNSLPTNVRTWLEEDLLQEAQEFYEQPKNFATGWEPGLDWGRPTFPTATGSLARHGLVPPDTLVKVRVEKTQLLKPGPSGDGRMVGEPFSVDKFALARSYLPGSGMPDYDRAAVIEVEGAFLDVFVPDFGFASFFTQIESSSYNTEYVPIGRLSEPWKTQLAEAIKKKGGG
jgi:hypothetical protein